ncbi:GIY-YIG nuclease family protein [Synechococcales cyanobacterium C]|uniref:GIY-YIG nuclease family protein n=1 Tax=Petrachloros mirabilis ULC683 TaxID=2781853 RepID=A0A8K2A130_9CYAN|nr:GIY-YIG nuclease family protein [Petrachloros mirabilis]NCJ07661.1 GIY-YIG nuclease family protein [Petrachloros mirabilis ULC683]
MDEQQSLFPEPIRYRQPRRSHQPRLQMSAAALQEWKQRVFRFQQQVQSQPIAQGSLFSREPNPALELNPFELRQQNTEFWRWRVSDAGEPSLYFVIDAEVPILLYVGETGKAHQRWKGVHDCKRYLANYRELHYQLQIPTQLQIGFWPCAPQLTRDRQQLERQFIHTWRSPFNKENWQHWGTPFVGDKR